MFRPLTQASFKLALALLLAGLHAWLLLAEWRAEALRDREPPPVAQAPVMVWFQRAPRAVETPSLTPAPRSSAARPSAPRAPAPREAILQAITPPGPTPTPVPMPAPDEAPAASPVPEPVAPLNLALPRGASAPWRGAGAGRNPALDDPRSNSAKPTLESRIAAALGGSDKITEYRLEDGSVRFKRGNACVIARPNRAGTLDPFNASAQIRPRLLDSC